MNPLAHALLVALVGSCVALLTYGLSASADTRLSALSGRYTQSLDAALRRLLLPARGRVILYLQCLVIAVSLLAAAALRDPLPCALAALAAPAPAAVLRYLQKRRRDAIERKLDGFALALANALRAAPSIGRALQNLQSTLPSPLDAEIGHVLRELRVGSSIEQALTSFSARISSDPLDALLSAVLVARRIGGSLPETLEITASTLREIARLEGVLRAKTAQSRMQMWVLGCMPPVLLLAFESANPGHFAVLTGSPLGWALLAAGVACWAGALVIARKVMAVEL
ncbi:MAG TPA: type II secretion system F family protein [Polyangiales bacterium]|nr:type II secretion system F family protein [Polyangiales bacterium]